MLLMLRLKLVLLLTNVLSELSLCFSFCFSFCFSKKHDVFYTSMIPDVTWYESLYNKNIVLLLYVSSWLLLYLLAMCWIYHNCSSRIALALNNPQRLICHKTKKANHTLVMLTMFFLLYLRSLFWVSFLIKFVTFREL